MQTVSFPYTGAGLGLRRDFLDDALQLSKRQDVDFWEVAPENWMHLGGSLGKKFRAMTEKHRFICHGLSLSIGSSDALDIDFIKQLKDFFRSHGIGYYSEHLSYCSAGGHLYDLMPIPFTGDAVQHVARRIRQVQDILEQRIAMENVSYYASFAGEMDEIDFLLAVLEEADCELHLDINNIYVNSINHGYNASEFLQRLPGERIAYAHIAGHYVEAEDLRVDTHGADVIDPVWQLLQQAYRQFGVFPTLLERDFNIPPLPRLLEEVEKIHRFQQERAASDTSLSQA